MKFAKRMSMLLAFGSVLAIMPECESRTRQNWSKIQEIDNTRRIRVVLKKHDSIKGNIKFIGRLYSVNQDSISIVTSNGIIRKFRKPEVRKILVRVPVVKRIPAWVMTGISAGLTVWLVRAWPDFTLLAGSRYPLHSFPVKLLRGTAFIVAPTWGISTLAMSHKPIYIAPKKK